jgi:hypothetical protein
MSSANGHAENASVENQSARGAGMVQKPKRLSRAAKMRQAVAELEVPFDPSVVEWRVMRMTWEGGRRRGQLIPFADPRAYTDRLNALFTPAGWTRRYTVHTSANFDRGRDQKRVAKVFVTCDLSIFGLGSHCATGEEWTDDENAGTSAEAQAFKRACSCFGLGRYLYYFSALWVDLDERKRPRDTLQLVGWATPEGWRQGLRPQADAEPGVTQIAGCEGIEEATTAGAMRPPEMELIGQIEALAEPLGRGLYRGLLKTVARVWEPRHIQDAAVLEQLLTEMQTAERELRRLESLLDGAGRESLASVLRTLHLKSMHEVRSLEALSEVIAALEAKAAEQDSRQS